MGPRPRARTVRPRPLGEVSIDADIDHLDLETRGAGQQMDGGSACGEVAHHLDRYLARVGADPGMGEAVVGAEHQDSGPICSGLQGFLQAGELHRPAF